MSTVNSNLASEITDRLADTLFEMLAIASPTYQEQAFVQWLRERCLRSLSQWQQVEHEDCLILKAPWQEGKPHIALVGHSDVVPEHFEPRYEESSDGVRLHGSGASDMKGALAVYVVLLESAAEQLLQHYNLSLLVYAREERTALTENGLNHLLRDLPEYFESLDLAIIGEPTDNTLQLGCVGSIHAHVRVHGLACHSARPWNGENALYKALPFLQAMSELQPVPHEVYGVTFYDVMQVTESQSEAGRTALPGWWQGSVNYRFAPVRSEVMAQTELRDALSRFGIAHEDIEIYDSVDSGRVIETELFTHLAQTLQRRFDCKIEAKQAWTDVAQLTAHGIAAFNFGPGLTAQAHKKDEYLLLEDLYSHYGMLLGALTADLGL